MKSVAAYALLGVATRKRKLLRDGRLCPMKSGIEACNLRQLGGAPRQRPDGRQVVRLMQGRQRNERLELGERSRVDEHGVGEARAPMDDSMPDGDDATLAEHAAP